MQQQDEALQSAGLIGDQPTKQDYLGFRPYVLAVAAFLTDSNTIPPLTLSVEGEWGSGKSSFLKQLKEELSKRKRPLYSVKFNPWRYNENEALWAAFAVEFEREIFKTACWYRKLWFKFSQIDYKKFLWDVLKIIALPSIVFIAKWVLPELFNNLKNYELIRIITALFVLVAIFFPAKDAFKEFQEKLSKNIMSLKLKDYICERPNYNGKIPFLDKFHEDIQKLAVSLCGDEPIYVFIDDLDRCEPGQALELMQALNLLISDELKIIFILAIDRKKIAAGYAAKHYQLVQYLDPVEFRLGDPQAERFKTYTAVKYGYEFLEKFIQVPFQLPIPKESNLNQLLSHIVKFKGPLVKAQENEEVFESASAALSTPKTRTIETVSAPFRIEKNLTIAQDIMVMISPALGNNPRRIKKFFNIFRLQTYIGSQTGLFAIRRADDDYQQGLSPIQLAKVLIIAQVWPHFIDHCQQFRYFMMYFRDYLSKKSWTDTELEQFKKIVCDVAGFQSGSEEAEQYWKIFTYWTKQKLLVDLCNYKGDKGEQYQIWTIPIGELLKVSPAYKTEQFTIPPLVAGSPLQSAEVTSSEVSFRNIDSAKVPASEYSAARLTEILNEVEDYLNANLKEGETRYYLDGAAAETAYIMRTNGRTLPEIKAEIDRFQGRSENSDYTEAQPGDKLGEPFEGPETRNPITGEWEDAPKDYYGGINYGGLEDVSSPRAIFSQIIQQIRSEYPDIAHIPFENQVEEFSLILLEKGDSAESVKQQILDYINSPNTIPEEQSQADPPAERKPFAYDTEGQGWDEGHWDDEPPTAEGKPKKAPPQGPAPTSNEASEPETRIREAKVDELPGTWDEMGGLIDDPRYVRETRNPETGEWENPVYIGRINPIVDSWENVDRVKNFDTGELYTDEEWAEIQRRQSEK